MDGVQFRDLESKVLQNTLSTLRYSTSTPFVISTGGGILERPLNQAALKTRKVKRNLPLKTFSRTKSLHHCISPIFTKFLINFKTALNSLLKPFKLDHNITLNGSRKIEIANKYFINSILQYLGK
jgi:hypothetical protein